MVTTDPGPGPVSPFDSRTNSSIAYCDFFGYFQVSNGTILAFPLKGVAEDLQFDQPFRVGNEAGVIGTSISCHDFFPSTSGPSGLHVFFQTVGNDIVEYVRGQDGGQWVSDLVPVD